jgi:hypothetical protein
MRIDYIVETVSSKRDVNGNCYHVATITSTRTGASLAFHANSRTHAAQLVYGVTGDHECAHCSEATIPIREFRYTSCQVKRYDVKPDEIEALHEGETK